MRIKNVALAAADVKAGPDDGLEDGEFIVYPSTFTRTPDSYGDVVKSGAFADTIKEWKDSGNTLPGLYGHRLDDPDFFVASAIDMGEDEHGWWVKGVFDLDSPKGAHVHRLVKGKRISQLSFAFDVIEEGKAEGEDGEPVNELRKLKVHEFSFVPIAANPDAGVLAVKDAVTALAKAGRVLSSKNESSLREARDAIDSVLSSLEDEDAKAARSGGSDQEQASGNPDATADASANDPERDTASVSANEPKANPSVDVLAAELSLLALGGTSEEGVRS